MVWRQVRFGAIGALRSTVVAMTRPALSRTRRDDTPSPWPRPDPPDLEEAPTSSLILSSLLYMS